MSNTPLITDGAAPQTGAEFLESIQESRFRAGGPSSSHLLNRAISAIQDDLTQAAEDIADCVDTQRILGLALAAQEAGLARAFSALNTRVSALSASHTSLAEFSLNTRTVTDPAQTLAEINPLFGQATLPATSRQNILVIEQAGTRPIIPTQASVKIAIQTGVTSSSGATPPADSAFGEDRYWVYAVDNDDRTFWPIEDSTTSHMAWIEVDLPGDVSGGYRCNELEFVPFPLFGTSLVAVQAEVIGQGWQDVDFTYVTGYNQPTGTVIGLGPMRLCFARTSIRRFRIGLFVSGLWGCSHIKAADAVYQSPAPVTVDFSVDSPGTITTVLTNGKDSQSLGLMTQAVSGSKVTLTLSSTSPTETPVLTSLGASW